MSRVLLTVSAVMRTPCSKGWALPVLTLALRLLSSAAPFAAGEPAPTAAPKTEVPLVALREPRPLPNPFDPAKPPGEEDGAPLLLFRERRSLAEAYKPEPGAIWPSGLSSRLPPWGDDPPLNMSFSTRAIWRASPYFTR